MFEYPPRYSHILGLKILPFLKIGMALSKVHGITVILGGGGGGAGGIEQPSPNHVAVNDRDMSLFGLHLRRKQEVYFPSLSVRSNPPWAQTCNIMEGFHKRIVRFKASLKEL
jgi:hypothetical protein